MSKCHCNTFIEKLTHYIKRVILTQNQPWDTFSQQLCKWNKDIIYHDEFEGWYWTPLAATDLVSVSTHWVDMSPSLSCFSSHEPGWVKQDLHILHTVWTGILSWMMKFIQHKPLSTEFWRLCSWPHKSEDLLKTC